MAFLGGATLVVARRRRQRPPAAAQDPADAAGAELEAAQRRGRSAQPAGPIDAVTRLLAAIKRGTPKLAAGEQAKVVARLAVLAEGVAASTPAFPMTAVAAQTKATKKRNRQPGDTTHKPLLKRFKQGAAGKPRTVQRGAGELNRAQKRGGKRPPRRSFKFLLTNK